MKHVGHLAGAYRRAAEDVLEVGRGPEVEGVAGVVARDLRGGTATLHRHSTLALAGIGWHWLVVAGMCW